MSKAHLREPGKLSIVWIAVSSVLLTACQSSAPVMRGGEGHEPLSPLQQRLLEEVQRWVGIPYCYGGASEACTDCSGFVQQIFAALGIWLPRTSAEQASAGREVVGPPRIGDLVLIFYGKRVRHVGIYLGGGRVAHASRSRGVVIEPLSNASAGGSSVRFRRILPL